MEKDIKNYDLPNIEENQTHQSIEVIALATATYGVAASIMPRGRTAPSQFNIPLSPTESSMCGISKQSGQAKLLRTEKLITWVEAPMAKRLTIEIVDRCLRDIMDTSQPFEGKVLPVVPKVLRQESVSASLVKSYLWSKMKVLKLTTNIRTRTDPYFGEFILKVGNGEELEIKMSNIRIPEEMIMKKNAKLAQYMTNRAILATKNEYVDSLNENMINMNPNPSNGLCNGIRMVCRSFGKNIIHAKITGQTISNVGVYLSQDFFFYGQLYVTLLRGVSLSTTKVLVKSGNKRKKKQTYTKKHNI
ncbi:hypothetical protein MANES_04G058328v8 [Manihot esculenta]|uniref:Uncharacterized protein n=1 Tax=Manihot esculenta TaxID=3983 RepID=A0ACB7HUX8_MANES|nr:hypothetical protein MANES_04G058328v8 [Manihot esculenta]